MRSFILATTLAGAAIAQSADDLPACGQICISNMLNLSTTLGCPLVDGKPEGACLCGNADFGYGIRDCANEACDNPADVGAVINYGLAYCRAAAAAVSASGSSAVPKTTAPAVTALATPKVDADASGLSVSAKTDIVDLVSTYTSGNNTFTTTFQSSLSVLATGVSSSEASFRGLFDNSTATAQKTDDVVTSTTAADEASATAASTSSSSVSKGGVAPMVTGALNGFAKAPIVVAAAAAAVMIL